MDLDNPGIVGWIKMNTTAYLSMFLSNGWFNWSSSEGRASMHSVCLDLYH